MRILIGEDEVLTAEYLKDIVESFGNKVVGIGHNKEDLIRLIDNYNPDLLLQDICMHNETDGIEIGNYVLENYSFP
ncbi:MAG: response regulator, partial [Bacteroidota bacterium]|nr:response regulator [Bacteroidota bacterium]